MSESREREQLWRTPCERDHHPSKIDNRSRNVPSIQLYHQAEVWPEDIPIATCREKQVSDEKKWPTPANRDYRDVNAKPLCERGGMTKGEQLPNYVEHKFLPKMDQAPLTNAENQNHSPITTPTEVANQSPSSPPAPQTSALGENSSLIIPNSRRQSARTKRKLNPQFVCWLMNWHPYWANPYAQISVVELAANKTRSREALLHLLGKVAQEANRDKRTT